MKVITFLFILSFVFTSAFILYGNYEKLSKWDLTELSEPIYNSINDYLKENDLMPMEITKKLGYLCMKHNKDMEENDYVENKFSDGRTVEEYALQENYPFTNIVMFAFKGSNYKDLQGQIFSNEEFLDVIKNPEVNSLGLYVSELQGEYLLTIITHVKKLHFERVLATYP